jgi:hypothetical protein
MGERNKQKKIQKEIKRTSKEKKIKKEIERERERVGRKRYRKIKSFNHLLLNQWQTHQK